MENNQTAMQSLLVHLEMLKSKVDTIDIQSLIDTIEQSYFEKDSNSDFRDKDYSNPDVDPRDKDYFDK